MGLNEFELDFKVRDYEVDLQGIVNNAVYLHYLEHTRHEFLYSKGIDFDGLHQQGTDLVVVKSEMEYKLSLKSRDEFKVALSLRKEGNLKMVFDQKIIRKSDGKTIIIASVSGVCLLKGRPVKPESVLNTSILGI